MPGTTTPPAPPPALQPFTPVVRPTPAPGYAGSNGYSDTLTPFPSDVRLLPIPPRPDTVDATIAAVPEAPATPPAAFGEFEHDGSVRNIYRYGEAKVFWGADAAVQARGAARRLAYQLDGWAGVYKPTPQQAQVFPVSGDDLHEPGPKQVYSLGGKIEIVGRQYMFGAAGSQREQIDAVEAREREAARPVVERANAAITRLRELETELPKVQEQARGFQPNFLQRIGLGHNPARDLQKLSQELSRQAVKVAEAAPSAIAAATTLNTTTAINGSNRFSGLVIGLQNKGSAHEGVLEAGTSAVRVTDKTSAELVTELVTDGKFRGAVLRDYDGQVYRVNGDLGNLDYAEQGDPRVLALIDGPRVVQFDSSGKAVRNFVPQRKG